MLEWRAAGPQTGPLQPASLILSGVYLSGLTPTSTQQKPGQLAIEWAGIAFSSEGQKSIFKMSRPWFTQSTRIWSHAGCLGAEVEVGWRSQQVQTLLKPPSEV